MTAVRCIWCGQHDPDPAREHIFPAALGCPDNFCLTQGEVCSSCNNGLGHLDQTIADDFDVMAFSRGVPRRGGKPPLVGNRRNVLGEVVDGKPNLYLNTERHSVELGDGRTLASFRGSGRDVPVTFAIDRESGKATINLSTTIGADPKFARAMHKIAFSCLAYHSGAEFCREPRYNEVRNFVSKKRRRETAPLRRHVLMLAASPEPFCFQSQPPVGPEGEIREIMPIRLGSPEFLVDLSPGQIHMPRLVEGCEQKFGKTGWVLIPPSRN